VPVVAIALLEGSGDVGLRIVHRAQTPVADVLQVGRLVHEREQPGGVACAGVAQAQSRGFPDGLHAVTLSKLPTDTRTSLLSRQLRFIRQAPNQTRQIATDPATGRYPQENEMDMIAAFLVTQLLLLSVVLGIEKMRDPGI
jgi:hypothetical protein